MNVPRSDQRRGIRRFTEIPELLLVLCYLHTEVFCINLYYRYLLLERGVLRLQSRILRFQSRILRLKLRYLAQRGVRAQPETEGTE